MIGTLKRSSLAISKRVGLTAYLAQSEWRRRRLLVLCYHGIARDDEHRWDPGLYVSADHFARRLALLHRAGCQVLPLGEAVERLYRNALPDRAVAITFDDGYVDFMTTAWPLLRKYDYPATVYLTTARMEHNFPIVNLFVSYLLWRASDRVLDGHGIPGLDGRFPLATSEQRQHVIDRMSAAIGAWIAQEKDRVAQSIAARLGFDYDALLANRTMMLMRRDEVAALSKEGVDFQLHTHLHRTPPEADVFVEDVLRNRDRIMEITGIQPTHLCYPSGVYHMSYLPALHREGVVSSTTCHPDLASRASNPLLLPRFVDTSAITDLEFEGWVSGVSSCLPRRPRRDPAVH
jgi:peptidoglycan/xylan/chitin deacetylase (PgdA/CDA1 family)